MSTLASDTFDRADSTSIGADWTEQSGSWAIASNKLSQSSSGTSHATWDTALSASPAADYSVTVTVRLTTTGGAGLTVRWQDDSNSYRTVVNTVSQYLRLNKRVAGTNTTLGQYNGGQSIDTDYTIKCSVVGSDFEVFQDGTSRITASDSDITAAGKPSLTSDSAGKLYDNFLVEGTLATSTVVKDLIMAGMIPFAR